MNPIKKYLFPAMLIFASCERVIDVDLNSVAPKYVIEGSITDDPGPYQVKITQTKNFDERNDFEGITGAEVSISDNAGNSYILNHTGNGTYETSGLNGTNGVGYTLRVNVGGETFVAESTMPSPPDFDSLYVDEFTTFGTPFKITTIRYNDPPGIKNYYRHLLFVNQQRIRSIFINTDELNDGLPAERPLPFFRENEDERLKAGDSVTVEVQAISREVYEYFFSLDQTIDQDAATPANPVSNIRGGALGYFSAHSIRRKSIVVE